MIDIHTHILPGIDDGPETLEESLMMARAAVAHGVRTLVATPHVRSDYPTRPETMERGLESLRSALAADDVPLEVVGGAELDLEVLMDLPQDELERFTLGGNSRHVLVEFAYVGWPLALPAVVLELRSRGITPVIAHPERNADVQADPERLRPLALTGALMQLTAASIDGRLGKRARSASFDLLERGLAHVVASDAHTPNIRAIGLGGAIEAIGDPDVAMWLTEDVPAAILTGEAPPLRPTARKPRRRLFLL